MTALCQAARLPLIAAALTLATVGAHARPFPLTAQSCGQPLRFDAPPKCAVVHDMNMTDMALGLQASMAGVSGISGWYQVRSQMVQAL